MKKVFMLFVVFFMTTFIFAQDNLSQAGLNVRNQIMTYLSAKRGCEPSILDDSNDILVDFNDYRYVISISDESKGYFYLRLYSYLGSAEEPTAKDRAISYWAINQLAQITKMAKCYLDGGLMTFSIELIINKSEDFTNFFEQYAKIIAGMFDDYTNYRNSYQEEQ